MMYKWRCQACDGPRALRRAAQPKYACSMCGNTGVQAIPAQELNLARLEFVKDTCNELR